MTQAEQALGYQRLDRALGLRDVSRAGIYLLLMNGLGMLVAASLTLWRHWFAPWLTGALAVGLIVWILVQLVVMPQTSWLQWFFLATGIALGVISLFWLRRTGQLRLW